MGVPEEEKDKEIESFFEEIIVETFPNSQNEIDTQVMKVQRAPNKRNSRKTTPRYIIIKTAKIKDKEKVLKEAREKKDYL